jgi:hypothetical protein
MRDSQRKRWVVLGGVFGAGISAVVVSALSVFAGAGLAARQAAPQNVDPPQISGTPQEGKVLKGDRGSWSNNPTDYNFFWQRCDSNGGSCSNIAGAHAGSYTLTSADVGNTLRFRVQASNKDGSSFASSVPTAVIQAATKPPPPPPATGCPAGSGPAPVSGITLPARLVVDQFTAAPFVLTRSTRQVTMRIHISDTCGQAVQGAMVYATAIPFNQIANLPAQPTGADGWVSLDFQMLTGYPVSSRQSLMAIYIQAKKPGDPPLAGISNTRLTSLPVNLH